MSHSPFGFVFTHLLQRLLHLFHSFILRLQVDPMFQKTAASFDECSTAGIFLTSLRTQSCHSELLFDSNIVPLPSSETFVLPNSDPVKVTDLKCECW